MKRYHDSNNSKTKHINRIKDSEIKIRVTKEVKKTLQDNAKKNGVSLSNYILTPHTKDAVELLKLIPDAIDTWNMLNELFCTMKSTPDTQIVKKINNILWTYLQINNQN